MRQWWPVAFLFALLALVFCFIFFVAIPRSGTGTSPAVNGQPSGAATGAQSPETGEGELSAEEQAKRFAEAVKQRQPNYTTTQWECPLDGTELQVPQQADRNSNNRFGGVATDLMAIALSPPAEEFGRPGLDQQDWEMLLVTCPTCRATFHGIDLWQLKNGDYTIGHWNLSELVPQLAVRDLDKWTVEERILVRVLTQRASGVEEVELGFSAMQGAYAANFDTWYGREVHIPSAAFYSLAAAYFKRSLDSSEAMTEEAHSVTSQTMGEAYRLLGRAEDAASALEQARKGEGQDPYRLQVLDQLDELLAAGDYSLQVARIADLEPPPGGWYLSEMLPSINSEIVYNRGAWNSYDDPDQVISAIIKLIP